MITIENSELRVGILEDGAEMQHLMDVRTGRELFWQGDARYWAGRSPILFPAVGGLWNGTYRYDGRAYAMPKHGFVRTRRWTVAAQAPESVTFVCEATEDERAVFPFLYRLGVTYALDGRRLTVDFAVENRGERTMFFQIGGHPAFNLPDFRADEEVNALIRLEGNVQHLLRAREQGCTQPERFPVPVDAHGFIPVSVETFAHEALIFDKQQVAFATLFTKSMRPIVTVHSTAPCWLFWSMTGVHCPYVCFEPWYGLCDPEGFDGPLEERPYIQSAAAGATWRGGYDITVF